MTVGISSSYLAGPGTATKGIVSWDLICWRFGTGTIWAGYVQTTSFRGEIFRRLLAQRASNEKHLRFLIPEAIPLHKGLWVGHQYSSEAISTLGHQAGSRHLSHKYCVYGPSGSNLLLGRKGAPSTWEAGT